MKERPILFSGPMVRAILEGRKTQTRRVLKDEWFHGCLTGDCPHIHQRECDACLAEYANTECPYGVPGDRLWVRETFRLRADQDEKPPSQDWWKSGAWYCVDGNDEPSGCGGGAGKKRPAIFMPRWASRITLDITNIRVQQLQDITEEDAKAEGVQMPDRIPEPPKWWSYKQEYQYLWNAINAKRGFGWETNPWVWALTFKKIETAKGQVA